MQSRKNKVGSQHSSAALIENATGDDKVTSYTIGARMSRLSVDEPLFKNFVAKASAGLISGQQTNLLKTTAFARLTRKIDNYPLYAQIALKGGLIKKLDSH